MSNIFLKIQRKMHNKIFINNKVKCGKGVIIKRNTDLICDEGKIKLGNNVTIFELSHIAAIEGGEISIGNNVFINRNMCMVSHGNIEIGNGCIIGPNVTIYDHNHIFSSSGIKNNEYKSGKVQIGKNCWIGAGTIILKDSEIGNNCVIGAGTVISGKIPDRSIVKQNSNNYIIENLR